MRKTIGSSSVYKAEYEVLLMNPNSKIILDKTCIKQLMSFEKATHFERKALNELISSNNLKFARLQKMKIKLGNLHSRGFLLFSVIFLLKFKYFSMREKFINFLIHCFNKQIYPAIDMGFPFSVLNMFYGECGLGVKL
jgi:hypothetical protein